MTLMISNKAIVGRQSLSDLTRIVLAFVDGGLQWIDWATSSSVAWYAFADETALAAAVQQGLHGSVYTLLPRLGLMVSPVKLMTLDLAELRILARIETGDENTAVAVQAQAILGRHGLVTQRELAGARTLLADLGVAGASLFQALGLDELLALHALLDPRIGGGEAQGLRAEAARFALEQARTPQEFVDYCQAYIGYLTRLKLLGEPPERRGELVGAALATFLPLLFPALDCPQVNGLVAPSEVAAAVTGWLQRGRPVGFSRLSEAAAQILQHSSFTGGTAAQAQQTINDYMTSWHAFLAVNPLGRGEMGQDGVSCRFAVEAKGLRGEVQLGQGGTITTRLFRRVAQSTASTRQESPDAAILGDVA